MNETKPPNPSGLKADIDAGRTGDKTPGFDPGAAPLGTDAEAAGAPASQSEIQAARLAEKGGPRHSSNEAHAAETPAGPPKTNRRLRTGAATAGLIALGGIVVAMACVILLGAS